MLLLLLIALAAPMRAAAQVRWTANFEIRSAFVVVDHGVLQLNAHVQYPVNDRIRSALQDGVTLAFDLEVTISRHRRLWFNATRAGNDAAARTDLSRRHRSLRAARRRRASSRRAFPTLEEALEKLGHIEDLPILVQSQLRGEGPWEVAVRAGVRRGRMPDALRALVFWTDDWHRTSDWYTWMLTL